ncbi:MAG: hypothetical protein Q9202_005009 [Teloschistes flavicans]
MCMRYLENNPGHLYIFTKRGDTLYRSWRCDAIERDPDTWGVFTRKDFGKSGMVEAVENMVSVCPVYQSLESLLTLADLRIRQGLGDTESSAKLVMLIGTCILTTIDHLVKANMFTADSEIQNIGFVIRLLLGAVVDFGVTCRANEDGWRFVVKKKTKDHGIAIRGFGRLATVRDQNLENMDEAPNFVEAYRSPPNPTASAPSVERSWGAWDWKQEVRFILISGKELFDTHCRWQFVAYSNVYGVDGKIGGNRYDLSEPDVRDAVAAAIDFSRTSTDSEPPVGVPD